MKKRLISMCLAAAVLALFGGCGNSENDIGNAAEEGRENVETVVMASNPFVGLAPIYIAMDQGYFEDQGLDFSMVDFDDSSASCSALLSGKVDMAYVTLDAAIISESHYDENTLKVVSVVDESAGADGILAANDINGIEGLKGKTIGVSINQTSHYLLLKALNSANVSEKEVNLVDMTPSDAGVSFISGNIDAAVTWEPYLSNAANQGVGKLIYSSADAPGSIVDVIAVNAKDDKAQWLQKVNAAYAKGLEFLEKEETHEEAVKIVAAHLEVTDEEVEAMLKTIHLFTPEDTKELMSKGGIVKQAVGDISDFYLEKGIIDKKVNAAQILKTE